MAARRRFPSGRCRGGLECVRAERLGAEARRHGACGHGLPGGVARPMVWRVLHGKSWLRCLAARRSEQPFGSREAVAVP